MSYTLDFMNPTVEGSALSTVELKAKTFNAAMREAEAFLKGVGYSFEEVAEIGPLPKKPGEPFTLRAYGVRLAGTHPCHECGEEAKPGERLCRHCADPGSLADFPEGEYPL